MSLPTLKIVRPAAIADAQLVSSNVLEAAAAWSSATTYALGAQATVLSGNSLLTVYESLQAGNLNHAPATSPTWWRSVSTAYAPWSSGTTYADKDRVTDPATHIVYEGVGAGNVGNDPLAASSTHWIAVGPDNRWAMFDQSNGSQTVRYGQIVTTLTPAGRVDSVALFNTEANTVHIVALAGAVTVYDQTYNLASTAGITDWYSWFSEPIERVKDLVVTDLPAYSSQTITVTVAASNSTAKVGTLIVGLKRDLGLTLADAAPGIVDYSKVTADDFGNYTIQKRAFSKKLTCQVVIDNPLVDQVFDLLAGYRATPIVWQGAEQFSSTAVFGFYRSFGIAFSYPDQSVCSLEIEGLT